MSRTFAFALPLVVLLACGEPEEDLAPAPSTSSLTSAADESSTGSSSGEADTSSSSGDGSTTSEPASSGGGESSSSADTTGSTTSEPASSTGVAAVCGDGAVEGSEACDDGDGDDTNECTNACEPWLCGDGILQPGKGEACDDGGTRPGDGCNKNCQVELECGKHFTTDWCLQAGTKQQYTRCAYVLDAGRTCGDPEIRYGTNEGGIPSGHDKDNPDTFAAGMNVWCQQLGHAGWSGSMIKGPRECSSPNGLVYFSQGYDEPGPHFVDGNWDDGYWRGPGYTLNEKDTPCDSEMLHEVTCD